MTLNAAIELGDSWANIITADGNEEFTLVFYAPWSDAYGPRGNGNRFAELGDPLVTAGGNVDDRLRLSRISVEPTMNDKDGCRYTQVYSSNNQGLKRKVPALRTSWTESFSSGMEVREVTKVIGATVGNYETGADRTVTDTDGSIIPKLVYIPSIPTYRVTYYVDTLQVGAYVNALGKVNSDNFFTENRRIESGDIAIKNAEGRVVLLEPGGDIAKWLFSDYSANRIGIDNFEVNVEFMYNPDKWNQAGGESFYLTTVFSDLFSFVKEIRRPDSTVPGRT